MAETKPQHKGTKQLFRNPILEKLSRTHISVPLTIFFLYSAVLMYWSITHTTLSFLVTVGMFFVGLLFFTWVEYWAHRGLFHMATPTKQKEEIQYTIHGVHHEF